MNRILLLGIVTICVSTFTALPKAVGDETELKSKISKLEARVEEQSALIAALKRERDQLKSELERLKEPAPSSSADPFRVGVVWVGEIKAEGVTGKFAISISEREGGNYKAGLVLQKPNGEKVEFQVSGKAPTGPEGDFTMQSPMVGRAQFFARGRLQNGEIALAYSGTNALGEKKVGPGTLRPKN